MKRNEDRIHFDNGYRQAVRDKELENFWPKIIGFWGILITAAFSWPLAFTILVWYSLFEFFNYRDEKKHGRDEEVPAMWE